MYLSLHCLNSHASYFVSNSQVILIKKALHTLHEVRLLLLFDLAYADTISDYYNQ